MINSINNFLTEYKIKIIYKLFQYYISRPVPKATFLINKNIQF